MKTPLMIIFFLFAVLLSKAQDLTLPKGSSTIFLNSGKTVMNTTLWRIDSIKVEYVIQGNLADVNTGDISKIETPEFLIEFDQWHQMKKKGYDIIVLISKDTLRGFIQRIEDGVISYRPVGSDKVKRAMKYEVESYSQWKEQGTKSIADTIANRDVTEIIYQAPDEEDSIAKNEPVSIYTNDLDAQENVGEPVVNSEKVNELYYQQSYERGVKDANADKGKSAGWAGEGFILGMTIGSPFLFLGAANSKVKVEKVPVGVDDKLYKVGYENEIVKKRSKRAAAGAIAGKFLILIILIASL